MLLPARYLTFALAVAAALGGMVWWWWLPMGHDIGRTLAFAVMWTGSVLAGVGVADLVQKRHAVLRNYPVLGHLRFLFEFIRPEIRQYFIEGDTDEKPFSRAQRSIVYQRAKGELDKRPMGTQADVLAPGYEWVNHSLAPSVIGSHDFRVTIGASCAQPYAMSLFNISAMSFGALSANAIRALNRGAKLGGFAHDTGEGSISTYHREHGGDLVWEVASGYFGCRNADGTFSAERFAEQAQQPQVKLIEVKLSQGAKPGHGGVLPAAKVTLEAAAASFEQAQAQARQQGNQARYSVLAADADGVITSVDAEPGQVVQAGTPVLRLARNGPRDVVFALPEDQLPLAKPGQRIGVRLWADPTQRLDATVREVAAAADPVTRTYQVKAALQAAPDALRLGMTATVELPGAGVGVAALKVPLTALFEQQGRSQVWVVDMQKSTVQAQPVQVAAAEGNEVAVLGLQPGQVVVTAGVHVLQPGQKVQPLTAPNLAPAAAASASASPGAR